MIIIYFAVFLRLLWSTAKAGPVDTGIWGDGYCVWLKSRSGRDR